MTSKPVIFTRESPELLGLCEKEILSHGNLFSFWDAPAVFPIRDECLVDDPAKKASWPDRWRISIKLNITKKISSCLGVMALKSLVPQESVQSFFPN